MKEIRKAVYSNSTSNLTRKTQTMENYTWTEQ